MLTGIDGEVDALCFVGYHGKVGTTRSVLAHTISGGTVAQVRCNGQELGEIGLNAALAAQYGAVPVLVTGDDTLVREAESRPPNFAGAVDLEIDVLRPFMTERACLIPASSCGLRSLSAFTPPTSRTRTTSST